MPVDPSSPTALDARQIRRRFVRAAGASASADEPNVLVAEVRGRMLERLEYVRLEPRLVVDAGCGAGEALPMLAARFDGTRAVGFDVAVPLLARAVHAGEQRWLPQWLARWQRAAYQVAAAAADRLPLGDGVADCVWSNLALHRHADPAAVLAEWHRVLRAEGLVQFSTLGPDTLKELRASSRAAGEDRVHRFIDMHDIGDMLVHAGFADPVMDMEEITLTYRDLDGLLGDLRAAGATNASASRQRGLTGRAAFARLRAEYERLRRDGVLPATFEIVYGHAWKPRPTPGRARDGIAVIRPGEIGRRR